VAAFGGLPGAQATIRSVLILKEGGTMRLAGTAAGVFVMIEMLIFQNFVKLIPQAVFCGVLVKVGYDVFDFEPFIIYVKRAAESRIDARRSTDVLKKKYLRALADQQYDSTWEEVWAGVKEREAQSVYRSSDLRGCAVAHWDEVERASLVAEVKQQHAAREASRSPTARKMKVLRRSVKELGVAAADTLVDETKDLPTVRLRSSAFLICGVS
jgi:hypothetical protein